jgi:hypothetical protein
MKTVRASEIGAYLFCRRAWWYQQQSVPSDNIKEMVGGNHYHLRHGKKVLAAGLLRALSWLLLLLAFALLAAGLTELLFR